jgi:hypothetical protein
MSDLNCSRNVRLSGKVLWELVGFHPVDCNDEWRLIQDQLKSELAREIEESL